MPATATPRKPQTLARKLVETRNTSRNRGLAAMLGLGESERDAIRSNASAVNDVYGRGTLAGFLGIPGDLGGLMWDAGAAVNNKIKDVEVALGLVSPKQARYVPSGGMAYGGAEHIGQKMQEYGLVSPTRRPVAETLASLISPTGLYATAAKAPQMARAGVRMLDNLADSRGMGRGLANSQVGAIDYSAAPFRIRPFTKQELIDRGAYNLDTAYERYIPVDNVDGLDPAPATWVDDAGVERSFEPGQVIKDSIEVVYDPSTGGYQLMNGNHRMRQAMLDGDQQIRAFVEPIGGQIGADAVRSPQPVGNLGKMVAPQDEALRLAQQGGLPSLLSGGDNVRMGGPIEVWHGTDIEFDTPQAPLFLGDRAMAESYAADRASVSGFEPVLMGGTANFRKTATDADVKQVAKSLGIEVENDMAFSVLDPNISGKAISKRVMDALKAKGFDSAHIDDFSPQDPFTLTKSYVAFDPSALNIKRVKDK